MSKKVFEGVIGTKEVKVSVEVQEAASVQLRGDQSLAVEFPDEIYKNYPQGTGFLVRTTPGCYPILFSGGKAHIFTSEGLKEVSMEHPFVKREAEDVKT